jgi:hypothetical protein
MTGFGMGRTLPSATLEADWATRRKPDEQRTLAEATAERQPGAAELSAQKILTEIIASHRAEPDILRMRWVCIDLRSSNKPLLTSDRPIVFGTLSNPNAYIALPIGPKTSSSRHSMTGMKGSFRNPIQAMLLG